MIGASDTCIYAIVPLRADTGYVELHLGKDGDVKTLTYPNKFKYQFSRNVTTYLGKQDDPSITPGDVNNARLRRPIFIKFDSEGNMYIINEGRGSDANGGLTIFNSQEQYMSLIMSNTGYFYQPLMVDFNLAEDTLFLTNYSGERQTAEGTMGIGTLPRDAGFYVLSPLVMSEPITAARVHPVTGELFYAVCENKSVSKVYKYNMTTKERELQFDGLNKDCNDWNKQIISDIVFTRDGSMAYIIYRAFHEIYTSKYNFSTHKLEAQQYLCGKFDQAGYKDGFGSEVLFDQPVYGDVDDENNLYVGDRYNHCIRKVTPDGFVTTYAGQGRDNAGYKDGDPAEAQFRYPEGCAFGPDGALYVADRDNHTIRKIVVE